MSRSHQYQLLCLKLPMFPGSEHSNATSRPQLSCWATQRWLLLMWFILSEWLWPQQRSLVTSDRLQKKAILHLERMSQWLCGFSSSQSKRHTMKVNDLQGGTVSTVNRKLCLHCGILEDEKSNRTPCCYRMEFDDNAYCANICGDKKKIYKKVWHW